MTPEQIIAIINAAKAAGLSWLKAEGLEFRIGQEQSVAAFSESLKPLILTNPAPKEALKPEEEEKIKHTVEHLKSVMSMDDADLIDQLFPEPKEEAAS